eukprot:3265854-Alexandrium_andersonii.AAC.1
MQRTQCRRRSCKHGPTHAHAYTQTHHAQKLTRAHTHTLQSSIGFAWREDDRRHAARTSVQLG